jgi:hypothetical protein
MSSRSVAAEMDKYSDRRANSPSGSEHKIMSGELDQNKKTVTAIYDLMFDPCRTRDVVEKYVGNVYIHNVLTPSRMVRL